MKNFIFQFFDENLLSAWFKDERPQGLSWQSALKGYYTILWQNIKIGCSGFFLVKMVWAEVHGRASAGIDVLESSSSCPPFSPPYDVSLLSCDSKTKVASGPKLCTLVGHVTRMKTHYHFGPPSYRIRALRAI